MRLARTAWILVIAVAIAACHDRVLTPLAVTGVTPASASSLNDNAVSLSGSFPPAVQLELDSPASSTASTAYQVALHGPIDVPATQVVWVSNQQLNAVVPAGVQPGTYDLVVIDPGGRTSSLGAALTVSGECSTDAQCDDGLACTQDHCSVLGRCEHAVVSGNCLVGQRCYAEGQADPANGCEVCQPALSTTALSPAAEGTACSDGNPCTAGETCHAGVCGRGTAVVNGTPCDDGSACTQGETCQAGACGNPTFTVTCGPTTCAKAGTCDPATGQCVRANKDGQRCDDGSGCTTGDQCLGGECRGTPVCGNTPPRACVAAAPGAVVEGDVVTLDARCTHDDEDVVGALQFRFDFDGDGQWDTPLSATPVASHAYPDAGVFTAWVLVQDPSGTTDVSSTAVSVSSAAEDVLVTTAANESDPGATPANPGQTGLSVREAISYLNSTPGARVVRFLAPMSSHVDALSPLVIPGARIAGTDGVTLDFQGTNGSGACVQLNGANQALLHVGIANCAGPSLVLAASGARVRETEVRAGNGMASAGVQVLADQAQLGPELNVSGFTGTGIVLVGAGAFLQGGTVAGSTIGIDAAGTSHDDVIAQMELVQNGTGVRVGAGAANISIVQDTFEGNTTGVSVLDGGTSVSAFNDLFTHGKVALGGDPAAYSVVTPNGVFAVTDAGAAVPTVTADPRYIGPDAGDYRLVSTTGPSPAIDQGADAGIDLNGILPGLFNAAAPDLGAHEAP